MNDETKEPDDTGASKTWDDPNADPIADIQDAAEGMREDFGRHDLHKFDPDFTIDEVEALQAQVDSQEESVPDYEGPIGRVMVGEVSDMAVTVNRLLGLGDNVVFSERGARIVADRQEELGLEPTGIVQDETWACVLPTVQFGDHGPEVNILRQLLQVNDGIGFNGAVMDALEELGLEDGSYCDEIVWRVVLIHCGAEKR